MTENEKDITQRFKQLFSLLKVSPAEFSSEIGLNNNATISRIVAGKVKPSYEIINKILTRYPNVSGSWLLSGIGDILKENDKSPNISIMKDDNLIKQLQDEVIELKENLKFYRELCRELQDEKKNLLATNTPEKERSCLRVIGKGDPTLDKTKSRVINLQTQGGVLCIISKTVAV